MQVFMGVVNMVVWLVQKLAQAGQDIFAISSAIGYMGYCCIHGVRLN